MSIKSPPGQNNTIRPSYLGLGFRVEGLGFRFRV